MKRLRAELGPSAIDAQDAQLLALANEVQQELGGLALVAPSGPAANILIPVTFRQEAIELELFTAITTVGTPLDITLQELRVETFFPANSDSRSKLQSVVRRAVTQR